MRGVCFVAGGRVDASVFEPLVRNHVEWISQTPFGFVRSADSPRIVIPDPGRVYWGETDAGIEETTRLARSRGIRTILKPHLWVAGWHDTVWTGEIRMKSEADWEAWFASYRVFLLHYARLAERLGVEALAVGTELQGTTLGHEAEWRAMIAAVREVYRGKLTYAANWDREFEALPFWDALDFAGVQAYFPLTDRAHASVEELLAGWTRHLETLERVARRTGKRIVFTEVGYKSSEKAAVEPWLWKSDDAVSLEEQARCYEAMFRAVWGRPWFAGSYIWKWFPHFDTRRSPGDGNFTPQGKPAETVIRRWYSATEIPAGPVPPSP
jgi:hypothetical protein